MAQLSTVRELQRRISHMQPLKSEGEALPTRNELRSLLPHGSLQRGTTVSVQGSLQLALALMSATSASGAWCGAVGIPELGIEEAHRLGITLERFVLIPEPGSRALTITSTLSDVLTIVLLRSFNLPSSHEVERLSAKLRDHGSALIVLGAWPRAMSVLHVAGSRWTGLGHGHGLLSTRELNVRSHDKRGSLQHTVRLDVEPSATASGPTFPAPASSRTAHLEAVPS